MQTFLPYKSFQKSARCLDTKRLGKQRVECMQILQILLSKNSKACWKNHPAVLQWKGYEGKLYQYLIAICEEWKSRDYDNSKVGDFVSSLLFPVARKKYPLVSLIGSHTSDPFWLGNKKFHDSHKSRLLQKNYAYYKQFNWKVPLDLEYVWPVRKVKGD